MKAAPAERTRTEERIRSYGQTMRRAFLLTAGLHLVLTLAVNPSLILRLFAPETMIGFPGASRPGDLAPEGPPGGHDAFRIQARRLGGPSTLLNVEVYGAPSGARPANTSDSPSKTGEFDPVGALRQTNPGGGGTGTEVQIELDENWTVVGGSGGVARSERFQVLKIVRPPYPRSAIRAELEGVVRLEVQVDTTGHVAGVSTEVNTTGSRELEDAAIHAMLLWVFKPYEVRSRPVPFTLIVPFRYRLVD
jgi:TonB family protein